MMATEARTERLKAMSNEALKRYEQHLFGLYGKLQEEIGEEAAQGSTLAESWTAAFDEVERREFWKTNYEWTVKFPPQRNVFQRVADWIFG